MKKFIILASLLASITIHSATVIPTPVGRPAGALGPGVIIARSAPGILPIGRTLIRGRDKYGIQFNVIALSPYVSWQWDRDQHTLRVDCSAGHYEFPIKPPYPGWRFAITVSAGGPEPIYTEHSVMGYGYWLSKPCTLVVPEAVSTGAVLLPNMSSRHVVMRYEILP